MAERIVVRDDKAYFQVDTPAAELLVGSEICRVQFTTADDNFGDAMILVPIGSRTIAQVYQFVGASALTPIWLSLRS